MPTRTTLVILATASLGGAAIASCSSRALRDAGERAVSFASPLLPSSADGFYQLATGYPNSPTQNAYQAETAIAVAQTDANTATAIVTYNDGTEPTSYLAFPDRDSRQIFQGASLMGWSFIDFNPSQSLHQSMLSQPWTYGPTFTGGAKLRPPAGWAVLWGDPGIAVSQANPNYVFISNLAISKDNFAKQAAVNDAGASYLTTVDGVVDGACIAVSSDSGHHFTLDAMHCIPAPQVGTPPYGFDGGSMAAGADGKIYFATVGSAQEYVYFANSETDTFHPLGPGQDPFSGVNGGVIGHPRIRVAAGDSTLYIAAMSRDANSVYVNSWNGTSWGSAVPAAINLNLGSTDPGYYPNVLEASIPSFSPVFRSAIAFSFDVGGASSTTNDAVRVGFNTASADAYHVGVSYCDAALRSCITDPNWNTATYLTSANGEAEPIVRAGPNSTWVVTGKKLDGMTQFAFYLNVDSNGNRTLVPAGRADGAPWFFQTPCPTLLTDPTNNMVGTGFWGDYDEVTYAGTSGGLAYFMAAMTDSAARDNGGSPTGQANCQSQELYRSSPVHVGVALFQ